MKAENNVILTADGTPVDLAHAQCLRCDRVGTLKLETRLDVRPPGTYSIAGVQPKLAARTASWLVCTECGAECKGKP